MVHAADYSGMNLDELERKMKSNKAKDDALSKGMK